MARIDNLEFLSDVIPKTVPYKQFVKESKKTKEAGPKDSVEKGQTTLSAKSRTRNRFGGDGAQDDDEDGTDEDEAAALQLQGQPMHMEIRGGRSNGVKASQSVNGHNEQDDDASMEERFGIVQDCISA